MDFLSEILHRKKQEVKDIRVPYQKRPNSHSFHQALQKPGLSVIGEIKRKSPSKGDIDLNLDPVYLAKEYEMGGAAAISVLTDEKGFGGSLDDLKLVKQAVKIPVIQKDFIVDPVEISQAIAVSADAILLIVQALGERTRKFVEMAEEQGIDALVEVHNERDIEIALTAGAKIIGINNRDLHNFKVDLSHSEQLRSLLPGDCVLVAESGVTTVEDAHRLFQTKFDAVLIGEALVRSGDPRTLIHEMVDVSAN